MVRYIAGTPEDQADVAAHLIDHSDSLIVSGVALVETAFVLRSVYSVPREENGTQVVGSTVVYSQGPVPKFYPV